MNPYEVLGVPRDADEDTIKKAYKKMALKHHPDKNPENREEAEKRFKQIGEAMAILNDPQRKEMFDRFGSTDESRVGRAPHGEMSPEEIFDLFFGQQFAGARGQTFYYEFGSGGFRRGGGQGRGPANEPHEQTSFLSQIRPFLPLLMIMLFSFLGSDSTQSTTLYSLDRNGEFYVRRQTIDTAINYYVKDDFARKHASAIPEIEKRVALDYTQQISKLCDRENKKFRAALAKSKECDENCAQKLRDDFDFENCDELERLTKKRGRSQR